MKICDLCGAVLETEPNTIIIRLRSAVHSYAPAIDANGGILDGEQWKLLNGYCGEQHIDICTNCTIKIPLVINNIKHQSFKELGALYEGSQRRQPEGTVGPTPC
jgi:hypothetical protein